MVTQRFCKEVMTWKTLRHPNVLPLLGVTMGNHRFAMVSEWMANGNINEFIEAHSDVNRFELVGFPYPASLLVTESRFIPIAQRRCERIDVYTRSGDGPWGSEGGMDLTSGIISLTPNRLSRPTS